MPLYAYQCLECEQVMDIRHSYGAKDIKCSHCESYNIKKNLSSVLQVTKKCYNIKDKVGSQVQEAIKEAKEEVQVYKQDKKKRVYKKK